MKCVARTIGMPITSLTGDSQRLPQRDTWIVFAVLLVGLSVWDIARIHPPLPSPLIFQLTLARGEPKRAEPIVASGVMGRGDFLVIAYRDATTVTFVYDSWGRA